MSGVKLFEEKSVRSVYNEQIEKWYFSVQDVVAILTDSKDVKQYIKRMLCRDVILNNNWGTICTLVEMKAADGKTRKIQAAKAGGKVAGNARKELEQKSGAKIVSNQNFKDLTDIKKLEE